MVLLLSSVLLSALTPLGHFGVGQEAALVRPGPSAILAVTPDGGRPFNLSVHSNGRATIATKEGVIVGLTPTVRPDGILELVVAEADSKWPDDFKERVRLSLRMDEAARFTTAGLSGEVQWLGTTEALADQAPNSAGAPCSICCVECDGLTTCGCHVETHCGNCCCWMTCSCGSTGLAASLPMGLAGLVTGCQVPPARERR